MLRPSLIVLLLSTTGLGIVTACIPIGGEEGEGEGEEGEGEGEEGEGEGEEGEGEGETMTFCQTECADDGDCTAGFVCDAQTNTCVFRPTCVDDGVDEGDDCLTTLSGWAFSACTADGDCYGGLGLCVDLDGAGPGTDGGCALDPSSATGACTAPFAEVGAVGIAGGSITVCGNPNGVCVSGICTTAEPVTDCNDNASLCPAGWVCNANGTCSCDGDNDCTNINAGFVCLQGRCQCDGNDDCASATTGDACIQGACGCSGDGNCNGDQTCSQLGTFDEGDVD